MPFDLRVLINPFKAEGHPFEVFLVTAVYAFLGGLLAKAIFPSQASIIMVTFAVMAAMPLAYNVIRLEEERDEECSGKACPPTYRRHGRAVEAFTFMFLGLTAGFLAWYAIAGNAAFTEQTSTLYGVNAATASFQSPGMVGQIMLNNLRILAFSLGLSLLFGFGAVLIIAWNASVMAVAVGEFVRARIGMVTASTAVTGLSAGLVRYMLHGIPEIMAFLTAGLAGGIVYYGILNKAFDREMAKDTGTLLLISIVLLVAAAFLEVYVTPMVA
ncbi:stage II sporulation protein M [Candidatus Woesearchaeota archaeon]|nr:stage II sporulation protein M [Candidatus Woesearchaeota archaeon]